MKKPKFRCLAKYFFNNLQMKARPDLFLKRRDRKSYHDYVKRLKADRDPERYKKYLERRKERDRKNYQKRVAANRI